MNKIVLCVEADKAMQMMNKQMLEAKGFKVMLAMTLDEARRAMAVEMPGIIILDIHLPDGNGLDFLREIRQTSQIPVIALTNNKEEQDIVEGLASGCDDYIPKPHSFPILYARIEALLRRAQNVPETITKGSLVLETYSNTATIDGKELTLTGREFDVLFLFAQNEDKILETESIYEKIWKQPLINDTNAIKTIISRLRKKIEPSGFDISMVRGKGYIFTKS
jgi:DNA-binding response OmpR family regulator